MPDDTGRATDSERIDGLHGHIRSPGVLKIVCDDHGFYAIGDQIEDEDFYPSLREALDAMLEI